MLVRRLLSLGAAAAIVAACSSNAATTAPSSQPTVQPSQAVVQPSSAQTSSGPWTVDLTGPKCPSIASGQQVNLTFVPHTTANLTVDFWNRDVQRFEAAFPNIKVTLNFPPNEDLGAYLETLVASGSTPDVSMLLSDTPAFWPLLVPFDKTDPDLSQLVDASRVTIGGQILGIGPAKEIHNTIYYNMADFAKAGITTLPKTYTDFETVMQKLKAAGFVPMEAAWGSDGYWVLSHMFNTFSDAIKLDPNWYLDYAAGKVHFTDQAWIDAATRLRNWYVDGYFEPGVFGETYAQGEHDFLAGKAAMYQMGTWFSAAAAANPPSFQIGVFLGPSGNGQPYIQGIAARGDVGVFKSSQHVCEAQLLAKFISLDPASLKDYLDSDGQMSSIVLNSGPLQRNLTPLFQAGQTILNSGPMIITEFGMGDNSPRAGIDSGPTDALPLALGKIVEQGADPKTELATVDAAWAAAPPNPTVAP